MKALELMPGIRRAPIQFGRQRIELLPWCLGTCPSIHSVILSQFYAQRHLLQSDEFNKIPIDADSPFYLSEPKVRNIIRLIQLGWFAMGHLPYSDALEEIILKEKVKMIIILRDPRDVIVSHANYLAQKNSHYMYPLYKTLSEKDCLMVSIRGVPASANHPRMLSIRDRLQSIAAWTIHPSTYTTHFEKLIGPRGDGSLDTQIAELRAISEYLEIELPTDCLVSISNEIYGGTRTFRHGTNGRWRQDFDQEHRQACKDLIGDFLVKFGYEKNHEW